MYSNSLDENAEKTGHHTIFEFEMWRFTKCLLMQADLNHRYTTTSTSIYTPNQFHKKRHMKYTDETAKFPDCLDMTNSVLLLKLKKVSLPSVFFHLINLIRII